MARRSKAFFESFSEVRTECAALAGISKEQVIPALIACGRSKEVAALSNQVQRLDNAVTRHNEELFRTAK